MISKEDIESLAKLSRLKLSDSEIASLQMDVSTILEYVGQISRDGAVSATQSTNSGPVAPAHHNIMRDDTPRLAGDQLTGKEEAIRAQFPKNENNYNVVRKIIQKDE